jgi:hypothetical protein
MSLPATFQKLFYLIMPRKEELWNWRTVPVVYSEDSYRPTAHKAAFLPKDFTLAAVLESIHFTELNRQSKPHRALLIHNHEITGRFTEKEFKSRVKSFDGDHDLIRVELIPDDQVGVLPDELLQVVQVDIDASGYFKPVQFPFLLNCPPGATIELVREMIKEKLGIPDDSIGRYRFVAFDSSWAQIQDEKFELRNVLKRDAIVRRRPKDRLLMIRPGEGSALGRSTRQSLVISN